MDMEKCGAFIRERRLARGLSQQALAREVHVTREAVSKWENGRGFPEVSLIQPLSAALGVTVSELLLGEAGQTDGEALNTWLFLTEEEKRLRRRSTCWMLLAVGALILLYFGSEGWLSIAAGLLLGFAAVGLPIVVALRPSFSLGGISIASFGSCLTLVMKELLGIRQRVFVQDWAGLGDTIGASVTLCLLVGLATLAANALIFSGRKR